MLAWWSFFSGIGRYGIINGNESLYVESAREMVLSGQWAIPTLNDFPYLEKPPLLIWLLAAARLAFGTSEWVARLVTACAGLTLVLALTRYSVMLGLSALIKGPLSNALFGLILLADYAITR